MFAKSIIGSARFLMMPASSRLLYYDLGMSADDDGIVEAFTVMRTTGSSEDDLRVLCSKGFVRLLNEDLVAHITDWKRNNEIKSDRYHESIYKHLLVKLDDGSALETTCIQDGSNLEPQVRLGKDSIDKVSIGKEREGENALPAPKATHARTKFTPPSLEEVQAYCTERGNTVDAQRFVDYYASKGWVIGKSPMKDWKAAVRNWERREREQNSTLQSFETDDFFSAALANSYKLSGEAVT